MDSTGFGASLRNRTFGSYLDPSSGSDFGTPSEVGQKLRAAEHVDGDGWISVFKSWIKIVMCFVTMMVTTLIWGLIMIVLFPWPHQRIRQGNIYGRVTGKLLVSDLHFFFPPNLFLCKIFINLI